MAKAHLIIDMLDINNSSRAIKPNPSLSAFWVLTWQLPYFDTFYDNTVCITINSRATGNMISNSFVKQLGLPLAPNSQSFHQVDGSSPLQIVGETCLSVTCDSMFPHLRDLRDIENLDEDILASTPVMEKNDVAVLPAKQQVILGDGMWTLHLRIS